mgnify:CR=1 FL=1
MKNSPSLKHINCLLALAIIACPLFSQAQDFNKLAINRYQKTAKQVTIIRDNWGVPHIYGKTDADAVFGLIYAQCEDDFRRVEMNYIEKLGRLSEINGLSDVYTDLLNRIILDSTAAKKDFEQADEWLKKLLIAHADGINYYMYKHPTKKPLLLHHFEPWYALMWTDGSIGAINLGDVTVNELKAFYSNEAIVPLAKNNTIFEEPLPSGSNGFAFGPSKTASGNAILYINPHVTFYFRPEVAVESLEGLHAYGAVTWGQFFVYQGFNEHCGWMHTSGYSDVADLYIEKVQTTAKGFSYQYNDQLLPVTEKIISIQYLENGKLLSKSFKTYYTHHGPVMAKRNGQWISVKANNRSIKSLIQSWQRTKSKGFEDYKKNMEMLANTSNNTVFADDKGNIAYWHGNFIPKRDTAFNWSKPVDGSTSVTEWKGLHRLEEMIHVYNPSSGFLQNCNSTPFTVSGISSPKKENYPHYMALDGENFRGLNAVKIFKDRTQLTINKVIETAYDTHLAAFDLLIPALLNAYEKNKLDRNFSTLSAPIAVLKNWDRNASENSVATTLAIEWGQKLLPTILRANGKDELDQVQKTTLFAASNNTSLLLNSLLEVTKELTAKFRTWQKPWGEINRYQRLTGNIVEKYNDAEPSIPSGFAASTWGCLPSFVSKAYPNTNLRYGYNGNSFICAVEFGKKVIAKSLLAGGESSDLNSKHFADQAIPYTKGQFKEVLFYKEDVLKHIEKSYHPGE